MVPMAEAPDEVTHVWVAKFCAEQMRLPTLSDVKAAGPAAVYGSIPQFGYLPHIIALKTSCQLPQLVALRLGSLLMSVVAVIAAYFTGRWIFLTNRLLALALPYLLVFHPQFVLVGSYTNNDITASACASLVLLMLLRTLQRGLNLSISITIGCLLAWILLSKYSGLCLFPVALIFLVSAAWVHETSLLGLIFNLMAMVVPGLVLSGAWFYRNRIEFDGDITGTRTLHYIWTSTYHRRFDSYRSPLAIVLETRWWRMNFFSFWGWFGYMTRSLPRPFYYGYLTFVILAFAGGFRRLKDFAKELFNGVSNSQRSGLVRPLAWLMFITLAVANLLTSLAASSSGIAGPQGRYLFISEIPLMALMLGGLANLPAKMIKPTVWALLLFNLSTYFYSSCYLYSLYCLGKP